MREAMIQGRDPNADPPAIKTAAAYAASIGAVPCPLLVTKGATAAPPKPTHQSSSSSCRSANPPSATEAVAERASAAKGGTR